MAAGPAWGVTALPWPWLCCDTLCPPAVLHSGEYFLFESDSEEEEEVQEEPRPERPSAFQVSRAGGLQSQLGGWQCPQGADGPCPPPARLPGLGDQHQDGAAAAGAA